MLLKQAYNLLDIAMATRHIEDDEPEILQFNLTNPEQLTEQLKHADLNDEETDVLLSEAMRVNAQLKEALRKQQLEGNDSMPPRVQKNKPPPGYTGPLAPRNSRQTTLPPIVNKNEQKGSGKPHKDSKPKGQGQKGAISPKRKGSATKSKPAWDDRFVFG